jgi:Pentapeptide repeats (8 copies)
VKVKVNQEPHATLDRVLRLLSLLVPTRRLLHWRVTEGRLVWIIWGLIALALLLTIGARYDKGMWAWLDLLVVPAAIAVGVFLLDQQQQRRHEQDMERRAQDEALQAYLDKMSELLIDKELHKKSYGYDPERVTARAQTLAVLERLEDAPQHKRTVLLFLREARLINRYDHYNPKAEHKVLYHAHYVGLENADLSGADLEGARLISTDEKIPISLKGANLNGANLSGAKLRGADLREADLRNADLSGADLRPARLQKADLSKASLHNADPHKADLRGADLSGADLSGVHGITNEELQEQAKSLAGATMTDGRLHA